MSLLQPKVEHVDVAAYRIDTDLPEADGTLAWEATEMVVVWLCSEGLWSWGYSYTGAQAAATLLRDKLAPCVRGRNPCNIPAIWTDLQDALRNIGRPGLGMMAASAVDIALWDLKAKLLDLPLFHLLGQCRGDLPVYASGGFINYSDEQLAAQLSTWRKQGFNAGKIKIGADILAAQRRLALAREVLGDEFTLMVDANGAYYPRQALAMAEVLGAYDVRWFEEPVSSDHLDAMRWLRDRTPAGVAIAAGEYGWDESYFCQMLASGAVDVLQADATRCGISGFLKAAVLSDAFNVPLSAHCAPALHLSLGLSQSALLHAEYFHDHLRIENTLMDTGQGRESGRLFPLEERPGHGCIFKQDQAEAHRIG